MQRMKLGQQACIVKCTTEEFDEKYRAETKRKYGKGVECMLWLELYNNNELIAMSEEFMLVFKDGHTAYTSRGAENIIEATLSDCVKMILNVDYLD